MSDVLMISKPVVPPWNDSSKNLVHDLAWSMTRHRPIIMGRPDSPEAPPHGAVEAIYPVNACGFASSLRDQLRVMRRLVFGRKPALFHFFFAPNPRSSSAGRIARAMRRVPSVHTVCSTPRDDIDPKRVLFADVTVVLSRHTEARLHAAGVSPDRIVRIPPGIAMLDIPSLEARKHARAELGLPQAEPLIVYPGDLEFGNGPALVIDTLARLSHSTAQLAMACRRKTARAIEAETEIRQRIDAASLGSRVHWVGETRSIHALLGTADVVLLPTDTLYAKMDYPLVILEAMSMARPVVVVRGTAAAELEENSGVCVVAPNAEALAEAIDTLLTNANELSRNARQAFVSSYTRERMALRYEELYDRFS